MHGLINRAIQSFACTTYGAARWQAACHRAGLEETEFEAMLLYEDAVTTDVLAALCQELDRPVEEVLEDIGTFLVSDPQTEALRRLLRFGGETYVEFLHSLDDLPDRTRLAVSDLHLPELELRDHAPGQFTLICASGLPGFGWVMMGVLRALADDYGALAMLEHKGSDATGRELVSITLVESAFASGRRFELGARTR